MKNVKAGHKRPVVCLDAGHYGKYNQSPVVPAYYESDMNWKLHLMLKARLEAYGIEVKTTRASQDKDLSLYKRGAASKGCDLFLSLHSNACDRESEDSPVGFHLVDDKGSNIDEQSRELAVLLTEAVGEVMKTKGKAQQRSKLSSSDRDGDGKLDDDYYGVLNGAHEVGTAGLILEHSFHTNARAAKWLLKDSNLEKLAGAEAEVIAAYYGMEKTEEKAEEKTEAKAEPKVEKWYRIRKTWDDAGSQISASKNLDNAKKNCPEGFTVYDWNGAAVYTAPTAAPNVDKAKGFDHTLAGTYKVNSHTGLNLRTGGTVNKPSIEVMPNGSTFQCYGYYTNGWLYGVSASGKTGFCSKAYLVKA